MLTIGARSPSHPTLDPRLSFQTLYGPNPYLHAAVPQTAARPNLWLVHSSVAIVRVGPYPIPFATRRSRYSAMGYEEGVDDSIVVMKMSDVKNDERWNMDNTKVAKDTVRKEQAGKLEESGALCTSPLYTKGKKAGQEKRKRSCLRSYKKE